MGMRLADLGVEIAPAVVAHREKSYRIDMARLKRADELLLVELGSYVLYVLGGMEVEVDLSET
jgi:hypothetical protein